VQCHHHAAVMEQALCASLTRAADRRLPPTQAASYCLRARRARTGAPSWMVLWAAPFDAASVIWRR
jgi:hypothetical protein